MSKAKRVAPWCESSDYKGDPCLRRCINCPDPELNGSEHHWMYEATEENPEGEYSCRHCSATRGIPIDDEAFLDAFPV